MSDRVIRRRVRNYLTDPSNENAHALAAAVCRTHSPSSTCDWVGLLERNPRNGNNFRALVFGDGIRLSLQGSTGHYCSPRRTLPAVDYTEMEVALFGLGDYESADIPFELKEHFNPNESFGTGDGMLATWCPVEVISRLVNYLAGRFGAPRVESAPKSPS